MEKKETDINHIPQKIGLCFSGGGYRAAGYHLGTLDYLDHLGLREKVTMMSTVSGGTFIGTSYAVSLVDKTPFSRYFTDAYTFLRNSTYVEDLLRLVGTEMPGPQRQKQGRNLIQAAAEMYATGFLSDAKTKEPYLFGKITDADIPLRTVIFNATCFFTGLNFRFQTGKTPYIGTPHSFVTMDAARQIRLGDIAAASSCFPGGFEPLAFPSDFVWPTNSGIPNYRDSAVMDGGVADNVGLDSLRTASEEEQQELDLIIASDVDPVPFDLYSAFPLQPGAAQFMQRESRIGLTLGSLNIILLLTAGALLIAMIGSGVVWWNTLSREGFRLGTFIFSLIPALMCGAVAGGIFWIRKLFRATVLDWFDDKMKRTGGKSWHAFRRISLGQALNMIKLRVTSIFAMTSNIFIRCIRKLVYDGCYRDPKYAKKTIPSLIYLVKEAQYDPYHYTKENADIQRIPTSPELIRVVEAVAGMNSTLWWEHDYQLPSLVATGQITLCFSLLQHYLKNYPLNEQGLPKIDNEEERKRFDALAADWEKLCNDPYALIKERYPGLNDPPLPYPPDTGG